MDTRTVLLYDKSNWPSMHIPSKTVLLTIIEEAEIMDCTIDSEREREDYTIWSIS